jgi:hypothetical protein
VTAGVATAAPGYDADDGEPAPPGPTKEHAMTNSADEPLRDEDIESSSSSGHGPADATDADGTDGAAGGGADADGTDGVDGDGTDGGDADGTDGGDADGTDGGDADGTDA